MLYTATFMLVVKTSVSPVDANILSANGSPIKVIGKTKLDIKLDNKEWCQEAIIADLNVDGILGMLSSSMVYK